LAAIRRRKKEEGRRRKKEEGRRKKEEEGRRKKEFLALSGKVRGPAHPTYRLITNDQ
jgi:hypothetical protein